MSSKEEIVGWLREASFAFGAVNCKPLQDQFNDRAAQVENMRCENCEKHNISKECFYGARLMFDDEFCWEFKQKVK